MPNAAWPRSPHVSALPTLRLARTDLHPDGMLVHKAYKFRIYPDAKQEKLFQQTIGCCRLIYNLCLDQKKLERERSDPRRLTAFDQMEELIALKREFPFVNEPPSQTLQQAIHDLHKAFKNFFEGRAGFPAFRRKGPLPGSQADQDRRRADFSAKSRLDTDGHAPTGRGQGEERHRFRGGRRLVRFDSSRTRTRPHPGQPRVEIGIDFGGVQPIVLPDGKVIDLPRTTAADRKRLADAQRVVARRQKGSRNRVRARRRVARLQARYARRRKDALHKATTMIAKNHGVIVIEDLKVAAMTKSGRGTVEDPGKLVQKQANRNRSLLDVSPRMIRTMLEYKAPWFGSRVIVVDPAQTSQSCSACGTVDVASRISRSNFVCTGCGSIFDADVNAAKNILKLGITSTGGPPGMACESSQTIGRKQEEHACESGSSALQGRE